MAKKNHPDEFKRDAVALYRVTAEATITQIAAARCQRGDTAGLVQSRWGADPAPQPHLGG